MPILSRTKKTTHVKMVDRREKARPLCLRPPPPPPDDARRWRSDPRSRDALDVDPGARANQMLAERSTLVKLDAISLKLTLNDKLLRKPFDQAVLSPFLKAYAKRAGTAVTLDQISCVKVDGVILGDLSIAASIVLLTTEAVDTEIILLHPDLRRREPPIPKPSFEYNPFGAVSDGPAARAPPGASLDDFDEDGRSDVERLKEARRAAREAREAAAAAGLSVGERVVVCGLQSDTGRAMNGLQGVVVGWIAEKQRWEVRLDGAEAHKTINLKPENARPLQPRPPARQGEAEEGEAEAPPAAPAALASSASVAPSSEALEAQLEALLSAEGDGAMRREVAELRTSLAQVDEEDVEAVEELGELRERATALRGRLAARQAALDEVDLSALEEEAGQAARGRRKAACAALETLLPEVQALCEEILAARKRLA